MNRIDPCLGELPVTHPPVCLHPENPKILMFRGAPLMLITATEHYGAVLNRPFRFERYLADDGRAGHYSDPPLHPVQRAPGAEKPVFDLQARVADRGFTMDAVDIVNMHPADNMRYRGRSYDLGEFMQGNLKLAELQRYCLDLYAEPKPLNLDEDNSASQYKNTMGWTVHRKRAWTALFCGAHYDAIDFSIVNGFETGTEESRRGLRAWFGHLARFIHGLDLVRARPMPELIGALPEHAVGSLLAIPGECYELYLADRRERDQPGAGEMIAGQVVMDLADCELVVS